MIEFMQESSGNVLGVKAAGKLTENDYERRLIPRLESLIARFGIVRVLFYMDETFQGWDLKSAWANTTLDLRHRADFERIAVVGAPGWKEWCVKLAGLLMAGEIRTFHLINCSKLGMAACLNQCSARPIHFPVTKPVAGTVKVYLDGVEQLSGWSVDTTTGLVTFSTAPASGIEVTADFEFDVPVRFDTDHMAVTIETYRLHAWQQIPIVELRA